MLLYSGPLSLFSRKVEIALHEKGLPFDRELVPFSQSEGYSPKHPAVVAANPKGQVPVLVDGDLTLFDSTLILEYLEDAYPGRPLYPAGARERARCRLMELTADEILLPPIRSLMFRTSPPDPDPDRRRAQQTEARRAEGLLAERYRVLEARLGEAAFFCGGFTTADIALFMTILFANRLGGPPLDGCPALSAWYARVGARPGPARVAAEVAAADRALSRPIRPRRLAAVQA
ncbi:MAG: glutathione S-transferase family protein [Alphaproteobacteria bacterium]